MTDQPALLETYRILAAERLAAGPLAFLNGGSGACVTQRANQSEFDDIAILPRVLRDLRGGGTAVRLFAQTLEAPILVAPVAYQTLFAPQGEPATAMAAAAQGVGMVLSCQSATPMAVVQQVGEGNLAWFQLYWQGAGRDATMDLAQAAADAGFDALVLTVDAPVNGVRDSEVASGFRLPPGIGAVNLANAPQPKFAPLETGESLLFDRVASCLPTWEDVAWLCGNAPLPVVIKGVLSPADASLAVAAGAGALVVSNHGGRVLDGVPAAITALPAIADKVQGAIPVLMDSGIRRGSDIFKALALGASAVLVGRPVMWGLAVNGAQGASHVLRMLRDELEVTMMLAGCRTIADISRDCVHLNR
ncbi:alpha-hydroxy-acid oxidizing protein [Loktanella sp. R86503]|uniref:alpha-hydroxy acid oxidase n=1 Tax=Loktanella sp. R86503 TaxID=3093847 RepID=UPI0036D836D6